MKIYFLARLLVLTLILSGCSVNVVQSTAPAPTIVMPTATERLVTPFPIIAPTDHAPEPSATPPPTPAPIQVAVTWASLNLTGKLVYTAMDSTTTTINIQALDLATGQLVTVFRASPEGWSDGVVVTPDKKTLTLAYLPPTKAPYGGQELLYRMPLDSSEAPQLLVTPSTSTDQYFQPAWSPDGKYIYFAHLDIQSMATYEIMRMAYPDGKPEKLVDHAYWPRISNDGTRLVYVALDPQTGVNSLFVANADGTGPHQIPVAGLRAPAVIDAPMFSPDDQSILFSSPDATQASVPSLIDRIFGVVSVLADGTLPSDWW